MSSVTVLEPWESCQSRCRRVGSASILNVPAAVSSSSGPGATGRTKEKVSGAGRRALAGGLLNVCSFPVGSAAPGVWFGHREAAAPETAYRNSRQRQHIRRTPLPALHSLPLDPCAGVE